MFPNVVIMIGSCGLATATPLSQFARRAEFIIARRLLLVERGLKNFARKVPSTSIRFFVF
jgi:hypothetical protein